MRSLTAARWGLRTYWRSALVLVAALVAALAVALSVASWILPHYPVLAPRFGLAPVPAWDTGEPWTSLSRSPTLVQWSAMIALFRGLTGQTAAVCLVAVLTVVGVSFARASGRAEEVAVRRAVGATRGTVVRSALIEVGAIAALSVVGGGLIGAVASRLAIGAWEGVVWPASATPVVGVVAGLLLVLAVDAALTAAPAWRRVLPPPLSKTPALSVGALQLGLSLIGLAAGDVFLHRLTVLRGAPRSAEGQGDVYQLTTPAMERAQRSAAYTRLLERFTPDSALEASLESPGTRVGLGTVDMAIADCGRCAFGTMALSLKPVAAAHYLVSADTFRMLGLKVIHGRGITADDRLGAAPVAVVSRSVEYAGFQRPAIGRKIQIAGDGPARWYTVVGVVENRVPEALGGADLPSDGVYLSVLQHPAANVELLVRPRRSSGTPELPDVTGVARTAGIAVASRTPERTVLARETAPLEWFRRVFAWEGWVALAVACLGTGALMLIWVRSIRAELGLRRAVGATRSRVLGYVLVRAAVVAVAGVVIARWLGGLLWSAITAVVPGVPDLSVDTLLRFGAVLVLAALAAAAVPAWQASRASPASLTQAE